ASPPVALPSTCPSTHNRSSPHAASALTHRAPFSSKAARSAALNTIDRFSFKTPLIGWKSATLTNFPLPSPQSTKPSHMDIGLPAILLMNAATTGSPHRIQTTNPLG